MRLKEQVCEFIYNPGKIILLSLVLAISMMVMYSCFCLEIYRDVANCYAYMAREFSRCNWDVAFHPALPPMNIVLAGLLAMLGVEAYTAIIIISGMFYVLTIFPLYALLKRFLKPHEAAWGVLFFVIAPKIIRFSGMGLLESGRNFFLVLALMFLFKGLDAKNWRIWIYYGAALAGLALSRGEGFAIMFVLIGIAGFLLWRQGKYCLGLGSACKAVLPVLLVVVVVLTLLTPRLYQNYKAIGYPVIDQRMSDSIKAFFSNSEQTSVTSEIVTGTKPEENLSMAKRFAEMLKGLSRGAYEVYLILAGLGLILVLSRKAWRYEYTVFIVIAAVHSILYFKVTSAYRYYTFALPLILPFTIIAVVQLFNWAERFKLEKFLFLALVGLFIGQIVNGMGMAFSRKNLYQKNLAEWINDNRNIFEDASRRDKLKMFSCNLPEVCFWSDALSLSGYGDTFNLRKDKDFDVIVVESDDKFYLEIIRARADVVEVSQPCTNKILVFRKK